MKSIKTFFKDYWITLLIVLGMCFTYYIISQNGLISPLMFPKVDLIWKVFLENRNIQLTNVYASFTLLAPSILITLILALGIGLFMGINEKARKVLYPIVYGFSCVPSILLSPFVVLLSPNMWWASIIIIVYGCVWATLFATITGVQTIDKRYLDNAKTLEDLRIPPSNHLEKLSGDRAGQYSIRINKQFRLCFSFHLAEARNVEIVDYH